LRDRPSDDDEDVLRTSGAKGTHRLARQRHVGTTEEAQPDDLYVLLDGDGSDRLRALPDPEVDDLEPGVA
jgi:hypothetical protein